MTEMTDGTDTALPTSDSLRADVTGAQRCGLRAVWKRNHPPDPGADAGDRPDAVVDDLGELRALPFLRRRV